MNATSHKYKLGQWIHCEVVALSSGKEEIRWRSTDHPTKRIVRVLIIGYTGADYIVLLTDDLGVEGWKIVDSHNHLDRSYLGKFGWNVPEKYIIGLAHKERCGICHGKANG